MAPHLFAREMSQGKWIGYDYLIYISKIIAKAVIRGGARIIIEAPPRHGKSLLSSFWTPPWFMNLFPDKNVILASYSSEYAEQYGREVRNLVQNHGDRLRFHLRQDSKAANRWNTNYGGSMTAVGAGGSLMGKGGDLIIIDDLVKSWQDAMSATQRKKNIDWYNTTLHTRLSPEGSVIVLMTRWHQGDLSGYLQKEHPDNWTVIRLPALAEEGDPMGRAEGTALCEERYSAEKLLQFRKAMGPTMFNALYQQRPSAEEGGDIKRRYIQYYRVKPPQFNKRIQSWDMSFKDKKTSDFVVGQEWGQNGAGIYLLDQVKDRMDFVATLHSVESFTAKHPGCTEKLVEPKANGPGIVAMLKKKIPGFIEVEPEGSKESRVAATAPYWEAGNIWLPHPDIAPWIHDFVEELVNFPNAPNDDQVDAATQAISRLIGKLVGEFTRNLIQNKGKTISGGMGSTW